MLLHQDSPHQMSLTRRGNERRQLVPVTRINVHAFVQPLLHSSLVSVARGCDQPHPRRAHGRHIHFARKLEWRRKVARRQRDNQLRLLPSPAEAVTAGIALTMIRMMRMKRMKRMMRMMRMMRMVMRDTCYGRGAPVFSGPFIGHYPTGSGGV